MFKHKLSEATFEQGLQSLQEAASQSQALWGAKEEAKPTTVLQELSFLPPEMNVCFFGETLFFLPTLHFPFCTAGLGSRECGIQPISVCIFHGRLWLYNSILNCHMIYLRRWGRCLHLFICKEKDAHNSLFI